jgi:hypothetical protein
MDFYGLEYLVSLSARPHWEAKCLLADAGLAVFPATLQHAQTVYPGICYREDYSGTAIAGMVRPGRVELRHHRGFADSRVAELWRSVISRPEAAALRSFQLTYQGRVLA